MRARPAERAIPISEKPNAYHEGACPLFRRARAFFRKGENAVSSVKKACITALCTALCYVLPLAFHAMGLGIAFSPMHLPVLLCGLLCGPLYGTFCGVAGPVISCLLSGMPAAAQLPYMVPELAAYGLTAGLMMHVLHTGSLLADLYCALVPAMLLGRVVGGAARALFYLAGARSYSIALWAGGYFAGTLPGTVMQLLVLPALVLALSRARLIPPKYPHRGETA